MGRTVVPDGVVPSGFLLVNRKGTVMVKEARYHGPATGGTWSYGSMSIQDVVDKESKKEASRKRKPFSKKRKGGLHKKGT